MPLTKLERQLYDALKESQWAGRGWYNDAECLNCGAWNEEHKDDCNIGQALKAAEEKEGT